MTVTLTDEEHRALHDGGTRTFGGRPILWHDGRLVHACVATGCDRPDRRARTLCRRAACCDEIVVSDDALVTCPVCHAAAVALGSPDRRWLVDRLRLS